LVFASSGESIFIKFSNPKYNFSQCIFLEAKNLNLCISKNIYLLQKSMSPNHIIYVKLQPL
jgi:hypothetical protein